MSNGVFKAGSFPIWPRRAPHTLEWLFKVKPRRWCRAEYYQSHLVSRSVVSSLLPLLRLGVTAKQCERAGMRWPKVNELLASIPSVP